MIFKPLDSLAKIVAGQSPESSTYNSTGQGLPFFQGKADFQDMYPTVRMWCTSEKRKVAEPDDILISVRAPVGVVNICNQRSIIGRGLAAIRPLSQLDGKFLYYYLKANERQIDALGTGSTFKAITQDTLKKIEIPVPSLDDQIRIAHLLGKVEGLIAQRKQHLQQLDDLLKSVFLEMFGYLEPNVLLGRECKFSQGIQIPMEEQFSEMSDGRVRFLRIIDFTQSDQPRYIVSPGDRYCVEKDDIVMVRYGASAGFVGFGKTGAIANNLFKFNFDKKRILPPYLYHCLKTGRFDAFIRKKAFGAAMPALSFGIIHDYSIAVPPIDLQNQFATIVEKVENIKSRYQQSLSDLEALYGTLSQRAFKGELDLTRVPLPSTQPEEKKVVTVEPQEYQK